jgi:hypothetical protein
MANAASTTTATPTSDVIVTLDVPIVRGDQTIAAVTLRKPSAGELRGLSLHEVAAMEVGTLTRLIPRISTPSLVDHEVRALDPADLTEMGVSIASFLLKKAQRESLAQ